MVYYSYASADVAYGEDEVEMDWENHEDYFCHEKNCKDLVVLQPYHQHILGSNNDDAFHNSPVVVVVVNVVGACLDAVRIYWGAYTVGFGRG